MAKILIVDDDSDLSGMLSLALSKKHDVSTARNGEEALEKTVSEEPAVVVLDCIMPVMDGIAYLKELQRIGYLRPLKGGGFDGVPVIGMSENSFAKKMLKYGAYFVLKKPFECKELSEKIEKAIMRNPTPYHW